MADINAVLGGSRGWGHWGRAADAALQVARSGAVARDGGTCAQRGLQAGAAADGCVTAVAGAALDVGRARAETRSGRSSAAAVRHTHTDAFDIVHRAGGLVRTGRRRWRSGVHAALKITRTGTVTRDGGARAGRSLLASAAAARGGACVVGAALYVRRSWAQTRGNCARAATGGDTYTDSFNATSGACILIRANPVASLKPICRGKLLTFHLGFHAKGTPH